MIFQYIINLLSWSLINIEVEWLFIIMWCIWREQDKKKNMADLLGI